MNSLLYAKLAKTNLSKNRQNILPYWLSCIGTVIMFYIMSTLSLSEGLKKMMGEATIQIVMQFGVYIIGLFAVIFLIYSNSFLAKRRKKEFGLFQILGMEKKHLAKVLFFESLYLWILSVGGGILLGILCYKLLFLVLLKLTRFQGTIHFAFHWKAAGNTVVLFAVIFLIIFDVPPTAFAVAAPGLSAGLLWRVAVLGIACAAMSIVFCVVMHRGEHYIAKALKNPYLRAAAGGFAIIGLTYLCGTTDYNGAGMELIERAIERGEAEPAAFALKLVFTAVTLGCGFRGGEVVPTFFIGATLGCVLGPLLGIPAGFAAAVGLVALFCGAVNCPVASIVLAVELFGSGGVVYFAVACAISYMLSGYTGLYSSQKIMYSKLRAEFIDIHAR